MPKVLISDKLHPDAAKIFESRGVEVDFRPGLPAAELIACIGDYDGLAVRSETKVTPGVLAVAPNLKVVGRAGIGVDNIDLAACSARGVVVMNTPFGNSITTAEHTIAMLFALARHIPQANASTHQGLWEKSRFMGTELTGKQIGIIGCGNIGAIVAQRVQGLKMRVLAYDPFLSDDRARELGVERCDLETLLHRAEIVTLHVPLTEQTRNILSRERLQACRKGALIINCARGGLLDEQALRDLVESGHLGGAAVDVYAQEPAKENVLFGCDRIICTPHLGASTAEAQVNVALHIAEQMADYLTEGAVSNALNMPSISAEDAVRLKPYMDLAAQIGSFSGQITESSLKRVTIRYEGAAAQLNTKPLTAIILTHILKPIMETVNMVNAPIIARERDITVAETLQEHCASYQSVIRVEIESDQRKRSVAGTLFDGTHPRLIAIDGVPVEIEITPHMLFLRNLDKPGLIGRLGTYLGNAGINIASFDLGRTAQGAEAICLISVDDLVDEGMLAGIRKIENIIQAHVLRF